MRAACKPPVFLKTVLDDPGPVRALLEQTAPHYPVQRYFSNAAEYRAQSGGNGQRGGMIIAPNFRGDWATADARVPGIEPILECPRLRDAASRLFGSDLVAPWGVYSNITWQLPFDQGQGHTDVPAFVGVDRTQYPTWFLSAMGHSGLFEKERVDIATAVAWFYAGRDGGFTYWPDGPDKTPKVHEGDIFNTGVVGDNDRMFHRVRPVGRREEGLLLGLRLDSRLEHDGGDDWAIRHDGETLAQMPFPELRVSVSWKAYVYRDAEHMRRHADSVGSLDLDAVVGRLRGDLRSRGIACPEPSDPLHDEAFVETLTSAYVTVPSVYDA